MINNGYIDISVQKGGVPGFSRCPEHTSAITQLIREARITMEIQSSLARSGKCLWLRTAHTSNESLNVIMYQKQSKKLSKAQKLL